MAGELVSISTEQWDRSLALYSAALNKSMREALFEEWPLLVRKVMDFTPPFKTGGGTGSSDLSVGRAAVNRDIRKTMRPFDPSSKSKQLKKIVEEKNLAAYNIIAGRVKKGPMVGTRAIHFSKDVHRSQRNARGRVGADRKQVVLGSDSGVLQEYIAHMQDAVGIAKAGWLPALLLVGGSAPGYVAKHGTGHGAYIDDHANELDPSITAINRTPWAVRKDEAQRIIGYALASRARAIESKVRTKLRLAAKEAKLGTAA
jgi:hypothetical protein